MTTLPTYRRCTLRHPYADALVHEVECAVGSYVEDDQRYLVLECPACLTRREIPAATDDEDDATCVIGFLLVAALALPIALWWLWWVS